MNAPVRHPLLQTTLRRMGNSTGLIIPKPILDQLGVASGATIEFRVGDGKIIAEPAKRKVRAGWAEAAKQVGEAGLAEGEREWLDCPNDFDDTEWRWQDSCHAGGRLNS